ncbi:unnamed protein product [Didymodactylos carnosus]|uniref:Uncharacterized protein n=1 Tax=Didymodactylos carnosus TaxID=1234261 RepID=A0A813TZ05_9BILA|nr:unnamed protein product [Didymodactylos carnosus]CAF1139606.1 unnamed protein product [Didymodactylos carnosus]CAF3604712.1 unnamed protein product [Didymodactylos carnosus]CAF3932972.1 unnamed protein product [Didymodactylos carnosus]
MKLTEESRKKMCLESRWTIMIVICGELFLFSLIVIGTLVIYYKFAQPAKNDVIQEIADSLDETRSISVQRSSLKARPENFGIPVDEVIDSICVHSQQLSLQQQQFWNV